MPLQIYNTLGRKKEPFIPLTPNTVRMYVCGPTVYDYSHIGHARSTVVFDVIVRYLKDQNYDVTYVRNFTDVDDKIIQRANELKEDPFRLANRFVDAFHEDMGALNIQKADIEPKATEHIPHIIQIIEKLIENGYAYEINGDVYFEIDTFSEYGKHSQRKLEDMEAGARISVDDKKKNPFDFALWKSAKPDEPYWNSPWGPGRPGWHIECSAMSATYLGDSFDIHGGGQDLIFPHHENEIAQSECANHAPFAKYWVHNGFVNINKEKMSKSLGNFLMIRDVLKLFHPETVRFFLVGSHYRSPIDFSDQSIAEAGQALDKLYTTLKRLEDPTGPKNPHPTEFTEYYTRFAEAMDDDFNTAKALGVLFDLSREINRLLDENTLPETLQPYKNDMHRMGNVFGLFARSPQAYFEEKNRLGLQDAGVDAAHIEDLIQKRATARKEKNWPEADHIRKELDDLNVVLEDSPDGTTTWRIKS